MLGSGLPIVSRGGSPEMARKWRIGEELHSVAQSVNVE